MGNVTPFKGPNLFQRIRRNLEGWRLPGATDRTSIVGKTGSGKTVFGVYLMLASRLYREMPWIILDYKGDALIQKIPAKILSVLHKPPVDPGVYRLYLNPFDDPEAVNGFLKKVWQNGNTGLFFDEAYMLPDRRGRTENSVLRALFTTGRARRIPIISLSQRPVDVLRYNFSEASHHVIFRLNDKRDRDTVRAYIPEAPFKESFESGMTLPAYHSLWYDVDQDLSFEMLPGPAEKALVAMFADIRQVKDWT